MSLASAVIDALIATGCTAEQLGAAMKAANAADDARREAKRENNAERQRRFKANQKALANASNALPDVSERDGVTEPALSRPPNENNLTHPPIPTQKTKPAHAKGHRLPDDWQPEPLNGEAAREVSVWPPGALERELSRFRDWAASATGPNAIKSNWQAAWRNWLKKAQDDGRYGRTPQQRNGFSGQGRTRDIGLEVAAELAARRDRGAGTADDLPRIGPPGRVYG